MIIKVFDAAWKLHQFIVDEGIIKGEIQQIVAADGQWYLFYWS